MMRKDDPLQSARSALKSVYWYYKNDQFNYIDLVGLIIFHIWGIYGFWLFPKAQWQTFAWFWTLVMASGFGITIGCHRLWSHRSFQAALPVRIVLMIFQSIAYQRTIHHWVLDHRVHHKYSDTPADPHNANYGFFYSHIGWLPLKKHKERLEAEKTIDMSDIMEDGPARFQYHTEWVLLNFLHLVFPSLVACYGWGEDRSVAFFICTCTRWVVTSQVTMLVNSAAHFWGDRPYDGSIRPADNPLVSLLAQGEGWHNWHHKYPFDYATSEFGISSQFNTSKLIIDALAAVGLVWGRKRATGMWSRLAEKQSPPVKVVEG